MADDELKVSDFPMGPPGGGANKPMAIEDAPVSIDDTVAAPEAAEPVVPAHSDPLDSPFSGIDISDIIQPKAQTPKLRDVFASVGRNNPDRTARIAQLSDQLGQPPSYIAANLESAERAAARPTDDIFAEIERDHPIAGKFLSDPKNMSVAHDDLGVILKTAIGIKDFMSSEMMLKATGLPYYLKQAIESPALNVAEARMLSTFARMPALAYDMAMLPGNLIQDFAGRPDLEVRAPEWLAENSVAKFYDAQAKAFMTPELEASITDLIGRKQYSQAGKVAAQQFLANLPNQAVFIAGALSGYGTAALVMAGAMQATGKNKEGKDAGVSPATGTLNALASGTIEAGFENLGTLGIIDHWAGAITSKYGKEAGKAIFKDFGKTLLAAFAGEATEEGLTSPAQDLTDYLTGVNPKALEGMGGRALDSAIIGGLSGVAMTGPAAIGAGVARGQEAKRAKKAAEFYMAMGKDAEASKLRERMPAAHKALIKELTAGTDVEHVRIPLANFEVLAQDPANLAGELGIEAAYKEAKETGSAVKVPLNEWVNKFVGTPIYDQLSGDVTFAEGALSLNQVKERDAVIGEKMVLMQTEAGEIIKTDAKAMEGHNLILEDVKTQLAAVGYMAGSKTQAKAIEDSAKITAAYYTTEAMRRGVDVRQLYTNEAPKISSAGLLVRPAALSSTEGAQADKSGQEKSDPNAQVLAQSSWRRTPATPQTSTEPHGEQPATQEGSPTPATAQPAPTKHSSAYDSIAAEAEKNKWGVGQAGLESGAETHPKLLAEMQRVFRSMDEREVKAMPFGEFLPKVLALIADESLAQFKNVNAIPDTLTPQQAAFFKQSIARAVDRYHLATGQANIPAHVQDALDDLDEFIRPDNKGSLHQDAAMVPYRPELADASYSKLIQTLDEKIQGKSATVEQVKALASNFKEDERKWTGFDKFVGDRPANSKIDKAELIEFLKANRLQVEDRVLGEPVEPDADTKAMDVAEALPESGLAVFTRWAAGRGENESALGRMWRESSRAVMSPLVRMFADEHPNAIETAPTEAEFRAWAATDGDWSEQNIANALRRHDAGESSQMYADFLEHRRVEAGGLPSIDELDEEELEQKVKDQYEGAISERSNEIESENIDSNFSEWGVTAAERETDWGEVEVDDVEEGDEEGKFTVHLNGANSIEVEAVDEDAAREAAEKMINDGDSTIELNKYWTLEQNGSDYRGQRYNHRTRQRENVETWFESETEAQNAADEANDRERENMWGNGDGTEYQTALDEYTEQVRNGELELDGYENGAVKKNKKKPGKKEFKWDKARYESSYVLPGAEPGSVRELIFHVPQLEAYAASDNTHFGDISEGKEIGWSRTALHRKDNGTVIRVANEFQNNRTQKGAAEGYEGENTEAFDAWRGANDKLAFTHQEASEKLRSIKEALTKKYYEAIDSGAKNLTNIHNYVTSEPEFQAADEAEQSAKANLSAHNNNKPKKGTVPDTPFKNAPYEFQFKRTLRWHIEQDYKRWQASGSGVPFIEWWKENGIKQLAWTTGMQQAERNNRVDDVDKLVYDPVKQELSAYKGGRKVVDSAKMAPDAIAERLGNSPQAQEIVKRLLATEPQKAAERGINFDKETGDERFFTADGNGRKIAVAKADFPELAAARAYATEVLYRGDEDHAGMHVIHDEGGIKVAANAKFYTDLYDVKIPSFVKKFTKQWGGTVGEAMIKTDEQLGENRYEGEEPGMFALNKVGREIAAGDNEHLKGAMSVILQNMKNGDSFSKVLADAANDAHDNSFHVIANKFGGSLVKDKVARHERVHALNITPEIAQAAITQGFPLFQGDGNNPQGEYVPSLNEIRLNKSSNETSYVHEFFHGALQHMHKFVLSGQADERYLAHWEAMRSHLGITKDQTALTREQQEKGARSFERYLRGEDDSATRAPSEELRGAFSRMRYWFTKAYRQIAGSPLEVDLPQPVREFMNRMLATEDQIAASMKDTGYKPSEIVDLPELDPVARVKVRTLQEKAKQRAEETLLKEQMAELTEEHRGVLDKHRAELTAAAETNVGRMPLYEAAEMLRKSIGIEKDQFGGKQVENAAEKMLAGKADHDTIAHFEAAAELNGFQDGVSLAREIARSMTADELVAAQVEQGMMRYAHLSNSDYIREKAAAAIHGELSGELLALEQQVLEEMSHKKEVAGAVSALRRTEARVAWESAKQRAREILAAKPWKEATAFRAYFTAERNSAVRVSKAVADGDMLKASVAKSQQMLNHALASEALRNRTEAQKKFKFLKKFAKRGSDMMGMPYGFVSQIDDLLASRGLSDSQDPESQDTLLAIAQKLQKAKGQPGDIANATGYVQSADGKWRRETLPEFAQRVNDSYFAMLLPSSVLMTPPLQQGGPAITMGELRDLVDAVKTINGIGRTFERFLNDFIKVDIHTAALEFAAQVEKNMGKPYADSLAPGHKYDARWKEQIAALKDLPNVYLNDMRTLLTICDVLDNGDPNGKAKELIYRPMKMATDDEMTRREKYIGEVNDIAAKFYKPKELAAYKTQPFQFAFVRNEDGSPRTFFRDEIMAMARNWGNAGNRDRIMNGFKLDEIQVRTILDAAMSKKDWDFTQAVWDHLQTYWPDIVALEMKARGVEPVGVDAMPVHTGFGTYKGGYYPISYDSSKSLDAFRHSQEKTALYQQYSAAQAHTDRGHAEQRVKSLGRPVRLHADVLINHIEQVNHDLAFRAAVIDVTRFLRQPEVRSSITNAIGQDGLKTIEDHLKATAFEEGDPVDGAESLLKWFRFKATLSILAIRPVMLPINLGANIIQAVGQMGPKFFTAMKDNALRGDSRAVVHSKSALMRHRSETRERDTFDVARSFEDESGLKKTFAQWAFAADAIADQLVSEPMWLKLYQDAILSGQPEHTAVNIADEAVVKTFGSGRQIDRIEAQRGNEWKKSTAMFLSFQSMMFNRWLRSTGMAQIESRQGNTGTAAAIMLKAMTFTVIMPAVYETFVREAFRNAPHGEDKEKKRKRILSKLLSAPFGYMWIARDIAPVIIENMLGTGRGQFSVSPMEDALQSILDIAKNPKDKQGHSKLPEMTAKTAAYLTGTPQQLLTWTFNYMDWLKHGGKLTWRDFLTKRAKR